MKAIKIHSIDLMVHSGRRRMFWDSKLQKYINGAKIEPKVYANRSDCLVCGNSIDLECHHIDVHAGRTKLKDYADFISIR